MKKLFALLLCAAVLMGVTACGKPADSDTPATTTGTTTTTTTVGEGSTTTTTTDGTTTDGTASSDTTSTSASTTVTTVPSSADGTTTTTATQKPTTTTTVPSQPSSSATTTTTGSKPTASTTVTTKPVAQPNVVQPAIGSDIDVVKKKNRIRVSAATAAFNTDGSIAISWTFKNYSSNWITEETDYVVYTCYDKDGNVVQAATKLFIGCIDTKKNSVKTYTFNVPAATAEVRITSSKITYWSEWV